MKPLLVLRHVDYERLGWIPGILEELNIPYLSRSLSLGESIPDVSDISGVISMGGPMSACQKQEYPFLEQEMTFINNLENSEIPFLGICLGAQLLAQAFGGKILHLEVELGWLKINALPDLKSDPLFKGLELPLLFQLHSDVICLPEGSTCLMKSEQCDVQAFRYGKYFYGIQFHPEANKEMLESVQEEYQLELTKEQQRLLQDEDGQYSQTARNWFKQVLERMFSAENSIL